MRLVDVEALKVGDQIGRSIYGDYGNLLLGKGVVLSERLMDKLHKHHIYYVYINDDLSEGIDPQGTICEDTMIRSVKTVRKIMEKMLDNKNKVSARGIIPLDEYIAVENIIKAIMEDINDNPDSLYMITGLIGTDMYTYQHSVNVAILTILTLKNMGYKEAVIKKIALGALLHDIGKAKIDTELINKSEKLTDDEFTEMKEHSNYGYDMIREDCVLSSYAKTIIKLHHEKLDGSGYPSGLKGNDIPEFVRLITICDMYDAMTTDRAYRRRMPIYEAIEILMGESIYRIDPLVLKTFIKNICIYPPGSGVKLLDGRIGIVKEYHAEFPDRPLLRIIGVDESSRFSKNDMYELDLLKELTVFIDMAHNIK